MRQSSLARQSSTASSSDTYTSCLTHLPSTPSTKGANHTVPDNYRSSVYVNPLSGETDNVSNNFQNYDVTKDANSSSKYSYDNYKYVTLKDRSDSDNLFSGHIVQKLDERLTATWQRFNSQPPLQGGDCRDGSDVTRVKACSRSHGGSLKRHRSETSHERERHLQFGDVMERTFSSTDNIHIDMQGFPKPKLKFRKAASLASRLHGSPSTGKKLANYHLIANPKSGTIFSKLLYNEYCVYIKVL